MVDIMLCPLGTYGLDINGNRYGMEEDLDRVRGYETQRDALNSLMVKYQYAELGLSRRC